MYKLKISIFSSVIIHILIVLIFVKNIFNNNQQIKFIKKNIVDNSVFIDFDINMNKKNNEKFNNNIYQCKKNSHLIDQSKKQIIDKNKKYHSELETKKESNLKKIQIGNIKNSKEILSRKNLSKNKNIKFNSSSNNIANNKNIVYSDEGHASSKYKKIKNDKDQIVKDDHYSYNDINNYQALINKSISEKFYNYDNYLGKKCDLHLELDSNGKLVSVNIEKGDKELCQAALLAVKAATIPKPPNKKIYELFKDTIIRFLPY